MSISFIGASIMELIPDDKLSARVITTMKLMGKTVVEDFEVFEFAVRIRRPGKSDAERTKKNLDTASY